MGWIALEEKDLLTGISWLQRGLQLSPEDVELLNELGAAYNKCGQWEAALETYSRAFELGVSADSQARSLRGRGYALIELERYDEARSSYLESLEMDPESKIAQAELAEIDQAEKRRPTKKP